MLSVKLALHDVVNYLSLRGCDLNQEDPQRKTVLGHYLLTPEDQMQNTKGKITLQKLLDHARRLVARGAQVNYTSETSEFGQTLLI